MGRKRVVNKGPLHPDIHHANRWADYLRNLGGYHDVRVESSTPVGKGQANTPY